MKYSIKNFDTNKEAKNFAITWAKTNLPECENKEFSLAITDIAWKDTINMENQMFILEEEIKNLDSRSGEIYYDEKTCNFIFERSYSTNHEEIEKFSKHLGIDLQPIRRIKLKKFSGITLILVPKESIDSKHSYAIILKKEHFQKFSGLILELVDMIKNDNYLNLNPALIIEI